MAVVVGMGGCGYKRRDFFFQKQVDAVNRDGSSNPRRTRVLRRTQSSAADILDDFVKVVPWLLDVYCLHWLAGRLAGRLKLVS